MTHSPSSAPSLKPTELIVGVDYDPTCRAAALHAIELARLFDARVHLLHASESPYVGHALNSQTTPADPQDHNVLHALQQNEAQAMATFAASLPAYEAVTWSVESGDPKRVLLDVAHKSPSSWVVLGARKHSALTDWLLGSTAGYVVRHCQVPVLVVPPQSYPSQT